MNQLPLLYRLLLPLLPADFRREYGRELVDTLAAKDHDAARVGRWRALRGRAKEGLALVRTAARLRLESRHRERRSKAGRQRLVDDVRFALRSHRRSLSLTAIVVVTLAFGIGANTALFSFTQQVLLRPLPVHEPRELVLLSAPGPGFGWRIGSNTLSYPAYEDLRDENEVFSGILARFPTPLTLERGDHLERVSGVLVSGNYFQVLGVGAELGRVLSPADDRVRGGHPVAVLSHRYWRERFAGDPGLVGSTIRLNGEPMTILGIARHGFDGIDPSQTPDLFVPLAMKPSMTPTWDRLDHRATAFVHVMARLDQGVSQQSAEASLRVLFSRMLERDLEEEEEELREDFVTRYRAKTLLMTPGERGLDGLRDQYGTALLVLQAMLALVLLIACANVANLLLARSAGRRKELAIHLALGASRLALARQRMVESLILALAGGFLGLGVAAWLARGLASLLPADLGAHFTLGPPDIQVFAFTLLLSLATALVVGLLPALQPSRASLAVILKDEIAASGGRARMGRLLAIAQTALALWLLMGAGLFGRSLHNLRQVDVGFETADLLSFSVEPPLSGYDLETTRSLVDALRRELGRLPGVSSVTAASIPALTDFRWVQTVHLPGWKAEGRAYTSMDMSSVEPGYFETLRIPLLQGRGIVASDLAGRPRVAVVNQALARELFGDEDPIGQRFGYSHQEPTSIEIVGLIQDGKYSSLREENRRFAYIPLQQDPDLSDLTFYLRTAAGQTSIAELQAAVRAVDPSLPIFSVSRVEEQVEASLFLDRAVAVLATALGLLACLLAALGLYGVMSYTVARRTREIGLRMALGAARGNVLGMVLKEVSQMAMLGLMVGIPLGLGLGRLVSSQLYGLSGWDPPTMLVAVFLSVAVAIAAGYLPAYRASRLDPVSALRVE